MTFSQGLLERIEEKDILLHSCNNEVGSCGGPLIKFSNNKIIGMHLGNLIYEK